MFSRTTAAILIAATTALGATAFTTAAHASTTTVAIDCAAGTVDYTGAPTGAALDVYVYDGTTPWWSIPVQGDGSVALPPDPGLVQSEVGLQANGTYTELAVDMVDCSAVTPPPTPEPTPTPTPTPTATPPGVGNGNGPDSTPPGWSQGKKRGWLK